MPFELHNISNRADSAAQLPLQIKALLDSLCFAPTPSAVISVDGRILGGNLALPKLLGSSHDEIDHCNLDQFVIEQDWRSFCDGVKKLQAGEVKSLRGIWSAKPLSGALAPMEFSVSPIPIGDDSARFFLLQLRLTDTEIKHEIFGDLFENTHEAILLFCEGRLYDCNSLALDALRFSEKDELRLASFAEIFVPRQPQERNPSTFFPERLKATSFDRPQHFQCYCRRTDGSQFLADVIVSALEQPGQKLVVKVALNDISDSLELEKLGNSILRIQRLDSVGRMANGIAHDINNMLTPILMSADSLSSREQFTSARRDLERIKKCARRGADIIKQLLLYSCSSTWSQEEIDLAILVEAIGRIVQETFPRAITFLKKLPDEDLLVKADALQLKQALLNLCLFARDAMALGGPLEVAVDVQLVDSSESGFAPDSPSAFAIARVSYVEKGFQGWSRGRKMESIEAIKERSLGISMAANIIEKHGGFLQVETRGEVGTTFVVGLPRLHCSNESYTLNDSGHARLGHGELILVADDEPMICAVTKELLERAGYQVICAYSEPEARRVLNERAAEIKLALVDMGIPVLAGESIIHRLRDLRPDLPLIAMSGMPCGTESDRCSAAPILLKPMLENELLEAVENGLA